MNNLKRVLSLALSGIMLVGMMAVGASAATFTDADDIKNNDAVNFMVALNIINGNDDGSFAPERVVSRAEMAKMITVALNGGKDPVLGTLANPTYSDIKGNWAEKYIEYCSNLGIISGRGDGTFDPAGTVTGTEAAKMMLVAMGYNSTIHGFTGADWALNVASAANDATPNSLFKGLETIDPSVGLSRDNAALLIYNGVQDAMMERSDSITVDDGKVSYGYKKNENKSILTEKYGYSVGYGFVNGVAFVEDDNAYDVTVVSRTYVSGEGDSAVYAKAFNSTIDRTKTAVNVTVSFKDDVSALYGQQVKVVYNKDNEAVGVYAVDSKVLATTTVGALANDMKTDATSIKVDGTTYRFDGTDKQAKDVPAYNFLQGAITGGTLDKLNAKAGAKSVKEYAVDLIDNDGNGRINCVVVYPVKAAKVTYLGKDTITLSNEIGNKDLEDDINVYEGVKKNDYVLYTAKENTVDGKASIVKAQIVTGTVGAVRTIDSTEIRVDGTWYNPTATVLTDSATPSIDSDVEMVMVNGYYAFVDATKNTSKDLLVVTAVGSKQDFNKTATAKVAFTDGSTATVTIKMAKNTDDVTQPDLFEDDGGKSVATGKNVVGKLFTYEKDGSTYVLKEATKKNTGYDVVIGETTFDSDADKLDSEAYVADDAVVFVLHDSGDKNDAEDYTTKVTELTSLGEVDIVTGKALKAWTKADYNVACGFADTTNGLDYAKVLVVAFKAEDLPGASGSTKYGYVVAKSYVAKDGSNYTYFDLWNGSETVSVKEKQDDTAYKAGDVIAYEDLGDGVVKVKDTSFKSGAVTGYNAGDKAIKIVVPTAEKTYKIDDDTKILYINSSDKKGVESEGIELAAKTSNEDKDEYEQNVYFVVGKEDHIDAIYVDVNNKLSGKDPVSAE